MIKSTLIPRASHSKKAGPLLDKPNSAALDCPIVLLHGWGCDSRIWESLVPVLNVYADLILLDIEYTYKNSDDCCHAIANVLPEKNILLGWSLGGMLATRLAAIYPEKVRALISLASNVSFVANYNWPNAMQPETFTGFFDLFVGNAQKALARFSLLQVKGDSDSKRQLNHLKNCLVDSAGLKTGLGYLREMNNLECLVNQVTCPSLYVFGEKDTLVPVSAAYELKKSLGTSESVAHQKVSVIHGKGHVLPYVDSTSELLTICADFLQSYLQSYKK